MLIIVVLTMASDPDQSNELSMLDGDDGNVSPDSPQDSFEGMTVHLEYFNHSLLGKCTLPCLTNIESL